MIRVFAVALVFFAGAFFAFSAQGKTLEELTPEDLQGITSFSELEERFDITIPDEFRVQFGEDGEGFPWIPLIMDLEEAGNVSCFDHYEFGSVLANIDSEIQSTVPGATINFRAIITNTNSYPIVDGTLLVKIFRRNTDVRSAVQFGNHVVDEFVVEKGIALDAELSRSIEFTWDVSEDVQSGEYYAATFFATADRYNLLGLSFTDDIIGGAHDFSIRGGAPSAYLNKETVIAGGEPFSFIGPPQALFGDDIEVVAEIVNESSEAKRGMITWRVYRWDALNEDNLISESKEPVAIPANGVQTIRHIVSDVESAVYMVVPELSIGDTRSLLNIRFIRAEVNVPRINFPSVQSFPLKGGEENTIFACLHNTGITPSIDDGKLTLSLIGRFGQTIQEYVYEGRITGAMMGVADTFSVGTDMDQFTLRATLEHQGEIVEEVDVVYDCTVINPSLCSGSDRTVYYVAAGIVLVLIIIGGTFALRKGKKEEVVIKEKTNTDITL